MLPIVVNMNKERFDISIGRGSQWGNPYPATDFRTLDESIDRYAEYLSEQIEKGKITIDELLSLEGKRLGGYYKPQRCHGDVIVEAVKWARKEKRKQKREVRRKERYR